MSQSYQSSFEGEVPNDLNYHCDQYCTQNNVTFSPQSKTPALRSQLDVSSTSRFDTRILSKEIKNIKEEKQNELKIQREQVDDWEQEGNFLHTYNNNNNSKTIEHLVRNGEEEKKQSKNSNILQHQQNTRKWNLNGQQINYLQARVENESVNKQLSKGQMRDKYLDKKCITLDDESNSFNQSIKINSHHQAQIPKQRETYNSIPIEEFQSEYRTIDKSEGSKEGGEQQNDQQVLKKLYDKYHKLNDLNCKLKKVNTQLKNEQQLLQEELYKQNEQLNQLEDAFKRTKSELDQVKGQKSCSNCEELMLQNKSYQQLLIQSTYSATNNSNMNTQNRIDDFYGKHSLKYSNNKLYDMIMALERDKISLQDKNSSLMNRYISNNIKHSSYPLQAKQIATEQQQKSHNQLPSSTQNPNKKLWSLDILNSLNTSYQAKPHNSFELPKKRAVTLDSNRGDSSTLLSFLDPCQSLESKYNQLYSKFSQILLENQELKQDSSSTSNCNQHKSLSKNKKSNLKKGKENSINQNCISGFSHTFSPNSNKESIVNNYLTLNSSISSHKKKNESNQIDNTLFSNPYISKVKWSKTRENQINTIDKENEEINSRANFKSIRSPSQKNNPQKQTRRKDAKQRNMSSQSYDEKENIKDQINIQFRREKSNQIESKIRSSSIISQANKKDEIQRHNRSNGKKMTDTIIDDCSKGCKQQIKLKEQSRPSKKGRSKSAQVRDQKISLLYSNVKI